MTTHLVTEVDAGVGIVTFNRPARHNAFDAAQVEALSAAMQAMAVDAGVRVVVLSGLGRSFCAGIDAEWLQAAPADFAAHQRAAAACAELLRRIADCPKPVIARVQGPAAGLGVGLIAACDLAVATFDARFALGEVRHGQLPAVCSPHVIAAIGARHARRYLLTAETFSAAEAYRIGLIQEMVADEEGLDAAVGEWVATLLQNGPQALAAGKALIRTVAGRSLDADVIDYTVDRAASLLVAPEGQEGLAALQEKRPPRWAETDL